MVGIEYLFFTVIVLGLIAIIILQAVFHRNDTRDLRDRLMSRDYHDYSVGKAIQKATPLTRAEDAQAAEEAIGGITQEDRDLSDRLPVS